jgi:hypothetical protein
MVCCSNNNYSVEVFEFENVRFKAFDLSGCQVARKKWSDHFTAIGK